MHSLIVIRIDYAALNTTLDYIKYYIMLHKNYTNTFSLYFILSNSIIYFIFHPYFMRWTFWKENKIISYPTFELLSLSKDLTQTEVLNTT